MAASCRRAGAEPQAAGGLLPRAATLGAGRPECRMAAGLLPCRGGGAGAGADADGHRAWTALRRAGGSVDGQRRYSTAEQ